METIMETERIIFIRPNLFYVKDMISTLNNPEISLMLGNEVFDLSEEDEIDWVGRHQDDYTFTMISKNTHEFIGNAGFNEINDNSGVIGIFINSKFQNIGLGTEAIAELIRLGFEQLNLDEIRLVVYSHNERAIRCYKKLGFVEYKRDLDVARRSNQAIDDVYMRLRR